MDSNGWKGKTFAFEDSGGSRPTNSHVWVDVSPFPKVEFFFQVPRCRSFSGGIGVHVWITVLVTEKMEGIVIET